MPVAHRGGNGRTSRLNWRIHGFSQRGQDNDEADEEARRFHVDRAADRGGDHRHHRRHRGAGAAPGADVGERGVGDRGRRAINSAQSIYAASCGSGFYAPTLANLATPPTVGGGDGFIGTDLNADPSTKSSYLVALTAGAAATGAPASCNGQAAGTVVSTYFTGGSPLAGGGTRYFGTNQGGTIYQNTVAVAVTQTGAPAGSNPIQ